MSRHFHTWFPKAPSTCFVVKNIAPFGKRIKIFNYPIVNGGTRDHVHRIVDPSTHVGGTSNLTTTSTSPVVAESITPGAGTYLVWWSTWGLHNNNFSELATGILSNGVLDSSTVRRSGGTNQSDGAELSLASQTKVTVSNGQAIAGAYWKFGGGGSVEINERTLTILKVDD